MLVQISADSESIAKFSSLKFACNLVASNSFVLMAQCRVRCCRCSRSKTEGSPSPLADQQALSMVWQRVSAHSFPPHLSCAVWEPINAIAVAGTRSGIV